MQKSRLGEKYNAIRHYKDPFYSNYMLKIFLSKLIRSGAAATGQRQIETTLKIAKLSNFIFDHNFELNNILLKKKRSIGLLRKRHYVLRTFYTYLRGRLSTFKMLHFALKNLWLPMELARTRRGKQLTFIPVPTRRNKKVIIARHWLFHPSFTTTSRRRMYYQLASDLTSTLVFSRSSLALRKKRQLTESLHEHRTEMERRWR